MDINRNSHKNAAEEIGKTITTGNSKRNTSKYKTDSKRFLQHKSDQQNKNQQQQYREIGNSVNRKIRAIKASYWEQFSNNDDNKMISMVHRKRFGKYDTTAEEPSKRIH